MMLNRIAVCAAFAFAAVLPARADVLPYDPPEVPIPEA
jgi:hypothetical protein